MKIFTKVAVKLLYIKHFYVEFLFRGILFFNTLEKFKDKQLNITNVVKDRNYIKFV